MHSVIACQPNNFVTRVLSACTSAAQGQDDRSGDVLSSDAPGSKAVATRRNPPPAWCTATVFEATSTDSMCSENTCRLIVRVVGRSVMAHLVVVLRCGVTEGVRRIASATTCCRANGRYPRHCEHRLNTAQATPWQTKKRGASMKRPARKFRPCAVGVYSAASFCSARAAKTKLAPQRRSMCFQLSLWRSLLRSLSRNCL